MEKSACQQKKRHLARGPTRRPWRLSRSGAMKTFRGHWGVLSTTDTFTPTFRRECALLATRRPRSSAAGKSSHWGTTSDSVTTGRSENNLSVCLPLYPFANIIQCDSNGLHVRLFTPSRCGRRVDYRFYHQLEQILGHEAVSIDEYDEREEQADQDPGTVVFIHSHSSTVFPQHPVSLSNCRVHLE